MTQTSTEVRVGADAQIYVAPAGTAQPANVTSALNAAFTTALGFVSEDGIAITDGKDVTPIGAMQSFYAVRQLVTGKTFEIVFSLMQWNRDTVETAFAGGTWTDQGTGKTKYQPPTPAELNEYVLVADWQDGTVDNRLVIPKVANVSPITITLARTSAALLPVTMSLLAPPAGQDAWYILSNDPALAS